jgi:hypothetical protein
MSGALQVVFQNQRSFGPPAIGEAFGGGFYAGQIGVSGVPTHYLVVGPLSTTQSQLAWKNANTATPGADSDINGPQNTADMVADGSSTVYPCAHFCKNLTIGGFTDWYMPAKNELEVCYYNLKPSTDNNQTGSGINPNAIPPRASNYTTSNPAQTSATAFQTGGAQQFNSTAGGDDSYWTSTEFSATNARNQRFANGYQLSGTGKTFAYKVRALRRIAV